MGVLYMGDYETVELSSVKEGDQNTALAVFGKRANYFERKCNELGICEDDVSEMLQIGKEFGASPVRLMKLYEKGNPVSYIGFLYQWAEDEKDAFIRNKREGIFGGYPLSMSKIDELVNLILDPRDGFSVAEEREIKDTLDCLADMCEQSGRNYRSALREATRLAQKYGLNIRDVIDEEGCIDYNYNPEEWN